MDKGERKEQTVLESIRKKQQNYRNKQNLLNNILK
jgi:hypothetical protein